MFGLFKKKKKKQQVEAKKLAPVVKVEVKQEPEQVKEEPVVEEAVVEEETPDKEAPKKPRKMSYHVTKHSSGGWQIKKGGAQKAQKRFSTQKEAIEYAKELEKKGASFVIHKADGTTRKKKY